ncbi:hypothetical protein HK098_000537 [Nowakowskiella sp. JEL0407]|nr:hypothetical protein HK098_000537 [Nowakowskiella sp. JEL0407]
MNEEVDLYGDSFGDDPQEDSLGYLYASSTPSASNPPANIPNNPDPQTLTSPAVSAQPLPPQNQPVSSAPSLLYKSIIVQNLTWWTTDQDIIDICEDLGLSSEFIKNELSFSEHHINGKSRGSVYLAFKTPAAAEKAKNFFETIELHGVQPKTTIGTVTNPYRTIPKATLTGAPPNPPPPSHQQQQPPQQFSQFPPSQMIPPQQQPYMDQYGNNRFQNSYRGRPPPPMQPQQPHFRPVPPQQGRGGGYWRDNRMGYGGGGGAYGYNQGYQGGQQNQPYMHRNDDQRYNSNYQNNQNQQSQQYQQGPPSQQQLPQSNFPPRVNQKSSFNDSASHTSQSIDPVGQGSNAKNPPSDSVRDEETSQAVSKVEKDGEEGFNDVESRKSVASGNGVVVHQNSATGYSREYIPDSQNGTNPTPTVFRTDYRPQQPPPPQGPPPQQQYTSRYNNEPPRDLQSSNYRQDYPPPPPPREPPPRSNENYNSGYGSSREYSNRDNREYGGSSGNYSGQPPPPPPPSSRYSESRYGNSNPPFSSSSRGDSRYDYRNESGYNNSSSQYKDEYYRSGGGNSGNYNNNNGPPIEKRKYEGESNNGYGREYGSGREYHSSGREFGSNNGNWGSRDHEYSGSYQSGSHSNGPPPPPVNSSSSSQYGREREYEGSYGRDYERRSGEYEPQNSQNLQYGQVSRDESKIMIKERSDSEGSEKGSVRRRRKREKREEGGEDVGETGTNEEDESVSSNEGKEVGKSIVGLAAKEKEERKRRERDGRKKKKRRHRSREREGHEKREHHREERRSSRDERGKK